MKKKIEYNGIVYKVTFDTYGSSCSKFIINGESSSIHINNEYLHNVESFKKNAKEAIEEYINRKIAAQKFNEWDGKI